MDILIVILYNYVKSDFVKAAVIAAVVKWLL